MLSLREQIAQNIVEALKEFDDPRCALVSRDPFEVEKIAITQFPAILVEMDTEERQTISMGTGNIGRRMGTITYNLRGFVRGTELDRQRNNLINAIELALDDDRYRNTEGVIDSQIRTIQVVPRMPPLAEFVITFQVTYNYLRGQS